MSLELNSRPALERAGQESARAAEQIRQARAELPRYPRKSERVEKMMSQVAEYLLKIDDQKQQGDNDE